MNENLIALISEQTLKNIFAFITILFVSVFAVAQDKTDTSFVEKTLFPAVTLLYTQSESGSMNMHCTATAFEKVEGGYIFATAAHCAVDNDIESNKYGEIVNTEYFITPDETASSKTFLKAEVIACGKQEKGDDFCLVYVKTDTIFPIVSIGVDSTNLGGESIVNVSSPLGLGKQTFYGRITSPKLDRSVVIDSINWTHTVLMQLPGTNSGSSGSAVICLQQHSVCGFLVGIIGTSTIVAVPVSKFTTFLANVKECRTKEYLSNENLEDSVFKFSCPKDDKDKK